MTFQTTKILGAAPGVQYNGVQDNSTGAPKVDLSVAVVVGRFKRGLIDRMFAVTKESIRARLGYQPSNPDYQVVQDALDLGVSQVWVRRIRGVIAGGEIPPPQPIGCEGATAWVAIQFEFADFPDYLMRPYRFWLNDQAVENPDGGFDFMLSTRIRNLINYPNDRPQLAIALDGVLSVAADNDRDESDYLRFDNLTADFVHLRIEQVDGYVIGHPNIDPPDGNQSLTITDGDVANLVATVATVCFSPDASLL